MGLKILSSRIVWVFLFCWPWFANAELISGDLEIPRESRAGDSVLFHEPEGINFSPYWLDGQYKMWNIVVPESGNKIVITDGDKDKLVNANYAQYFYHKVTDRSCAILNLFCVGEKVQVRYKAGGGMAGHTNYNDNVTIVGIYQRRPLPSKMKKILAALEVENAMASKVSINDSSHLLNTLMGSGVVFEVKMPNSDEVRVVQSQYVFGYNFSNDLAKTMSWELFLTGDQGIVVQGDELEFDSNKQIVDIKRDVREAVEGDIAGYEISYRFLKANYIDYLYDKLDSSGPIAFRPIIENNGRMVVGSSRHYYVEKLPVDTMVPEGIASTTYSIGMEVLYPHVYNYEKGDGEYARGKITGFYKRFSSFKSVMIGIDNTYIVPLTSSVLILQ